MACALTQGYVLDCRDGIGGSKEFYIAEFAAITLTIAAGVITAITKATGKQFYRYAQVKQTSETEEALTPNEEHGTVFSKQQVKLVINKRQTSVRNEIKLLGQNLVMIVEVDRNGRAWAFGATNGLMLAPSTSKSGRAMGDRNGYELHFEGVEPEFAFEVTSTLITALTTPGI